MILRESAARIRSRMFPRSIVVTEVGARDGLQSLDRFVSTDVKIQMIEAIAATGLRSIEVTSFAHPAIVPNLRDAEALLEGISHLDIEKRALVPNVRGARRACATEADVIVALTTASETYTRKNQNRSASDAAVEALRVTEIGSSENRRVSVVMGTAFFCPYDGVMPYDKVMSLLAPIVEAGVNDICFGDTAGFAHPKQVFDLCAAATSEWLEAVVAVHLHNTNALAGANLLASLAAGARRVESSMLGIGGGIRLPANMVGFGNIATEDVVRLLEESAIECDTNLTAVIAASREVGRMLDVPSSANVMTVGSREAVQSSVF